MTSANIGPRTSDQLQENLGALEVRLGPEAGEVLGEASAWDS